MTALDQIYALVGGSFKDYLKAVAVVESGQKVDALGDDGFAKGLFQQHKDFYDQWTPQESWVADWVDADPLWQAFAQMAAMNHHMSRGLTPVSALQCIHLGPARYQKEVVEGLQVDPDGWLARFHQEFNRT